MPFTPETDYPEPLSSFQWPTPVPSVDPLLGTGVQVQLPQEWIGLILGCLQQLKLETTWDTNDPNMIATAMLYADSLIYMVQERTLITPPGSIMVFGNHVAPTGWLLCDGSQYFQSDFPDLFAAIGTQYGAGSGSDTFQVPDFQGRVVVGSGTGSGLTPRLDGDSGGEETHTLTVGEMPSHAHTDAGHTHSYASSLTSTADIVPTEPVLIPNPLPGITGSGNASIQPTGGGGAHNNMQPFGVATWIIKV